MCILRYAIHACHNSSLLVPTPKCVAINKTTALNKTTTIILDIGVHFGTNCLTPSNLPVCIQCIFSTSLRVHCIYYTIHITICCSSQLIAEAYFLKRQAYF